MSVYYNEHDAYAAQWLRNLIAAGELPSGYVDERDIQDVRAEDLVGYTHCHFFAGIGGWPLALRLAGWPDDEPVWTGSCPCQPFSAAGRRKGAADDRHLWPEFRRLIAECTPRTVLGEQVASKDGIEQWWFAGVRPDMETLCYECGEVDLPAACLNAPHIRQRLWWVAYGNGERWQGAGYAAQGRKKFSGTGSNARLGGASSGLGHPARERREGLGLLLQPGESREAGVDADGSSADYGYWGDVEWVECREPNGRTVTRRLESGLAPLVDGLSFVLADGRARQDAPRGQILKGIGNAIVPQVAALFVEAVMEAR